MGRPTKYSHDNDDAIQQKYETGASLSSLSREYSIPVMTIKRRLIKRGVEIRNLTTAMQVMKENRQNRSVANNRSDERNVSFGVQFDDSGSNAGTTSDDEWMN
jgi:hypothetical protein